MATEPRLGDMGTSGFSFKLQCVDSQSAARRGVFQTPRGVIDTPAFMPVATAGSVKGLEVERIQATGTKMVLANTYHLAIRPGEEIVQQIGGLHEFMGWQGPILTDSGGFQIFSLARLTRVSDDGAEFRAHTDGRLMRLSPETAVLIQEKLGSDVAMVLDHVVSLPSERSKVNDACERTVLWAQRCRQAHKRSNQILFAIVQGGLEPDLRVRCAEELMKLDFPGYAIGGLSVGETPEDMYHMLDVTCPVLPADRPRYLMGVGRPVDLLHAIGRGVDLFDCVMPTRNGRNALAFTSNGTLRLRNEVHKSDPRPIENECPCPACRHSRAYIRHLFMAKEMLGPILLSSHNLTFYQRLMGEARQAISEHQFASFSDEMTRKLRPNGKGA